jgi:hypothetical protein
MKIQFPQLAVVLMLLTRLAVAQMYTPEPGDFKVTVPFDFALGKLALGGGNYVVYRETASNRLQICEDGVICETVEATALALAETTAEPQLVFSLYGDTHLLEQVCLPDGTALRLGTFFEESEAASARAKPEAVAVQGDVLCIHNTHGSPPSWH